VEPFGVNGVGCSRWKELQHVIEGVTVIKGVIIGKHFSGK
jgi:hypothetical protein